MTRESKSFSVFIKRFPIRLLTVYRIVDLTFRNLILRPIAHSRAPNQVSLLVSITSYGERVKWAYLAIESIIQSGCNPSDIYIWVPRGTKVGGNLKRLERRGLIIKHVVDQKSHTKYCYLDSLEPGDECLGYLIADDDMLYPRNWYPKMISAALKSPKLPIVFYGTQTYVSEAGVTFKSECAIEVNPTRAALLFHPFSGSGLFLPKTVVPKINKNPSTFLAICPSSDDIWLHRELFRLGLPISDLGGKSMPPSIPFISSSTALFRINWDGGQNEIQIANAFDGLI